MYKPAQMKIPNFTHGNGALYLVVCLRNFVREIRQRARKEVSEED